LKGEQEDDGDKDEIILKGVNKILSEMAEMKLKLKEIEAKVM